jgi:hypothetical protein
MPTFAEIKLAVALVALLGAAGTGFMLAHRLDASKYTNLELSYAQAQAKAVAQAQAEQARLDAIAVQAGQAEAAHQAALAASTAAQLREVKSHVQADSHCITWGLVRVLDAAVHRVSASSLVLPAGKSDGSCAPYGSDELARSVVGNYGIANQNAEQLNGLVGAIRKSRAPK